MNRWLMIGSMVGLLTLATGCLHHNTRGGCNSCNSCSKPGLLGKLASGHGACQSCGNQGACQGCGLHAGGYRPGCVAGPLAWQQGGHNYSSYLQPGVFGDGHRGVLGHGAAQQIQNQPFTPGPPSAQVAYPYYTHRGPRDFLLDNPPSIGN